MSDAKQYKFVLLEFRGSSHYGPKNNVRCVFRHNIIPICYILR